MKNEPLSIFWQRGPKKGVVLENHAHFCLTWAKKLEMVSMLKTTIFAIKNIVKYTFLVFLFSKHKVLTIIDIWMNLQQWTICPRVLKMALKIPKIKKLIKFIDI